MRRGNGRVTRLSKREKKNQRKREKQRQKQAQEHGINITVNVGKGHGEKGGERRARALREPRRRPQGVVQGQGQGVVYVTLPPGSNVGGAFQPQQQPQQQPKMMELVPLQQTSLIPDMERMQKEPSQKEQAPSQEQKEPSQAPPLFNPLQNQPPLIEVFDADTGRRAGEAEAIGQPSRTETAKEARQFSLQYSVNNSIRAYEDKHGKIPSDIIDNVRKSLVQLGESNKKMREAFEAAGGSKRVSIVAGVVRQLQQ